MASANKLLCRIFSCHGTHLFRFISNFIIILKFLSVNKFFTLCSTYITHQGGKMLHFLKNFLKNTKAHSEKIRYGLKL